MKVTWDEAKNRANRKKHGISFEEASELFAQSGDYFEIYDETHSGEEDRFIAIGPIARAKREKELYRSNTGRTIP